MVSPLYVGMLMQATELKPGTKVRMRNVGIVNEIDHVDKGGMIWVATFGFLNGYWPTRFREVYEVVPERESSETNDG